MLKKQDSKFSQIHEQITIRLQQGNLIPGDFVRFKKGWESDEWCKKQATGFLAKIKSVVGGEFPLRLSAMKTIKAMQNQWGTDATTDYIADIVEERSPGCYSLALTVPANLIEPVELTGSNPIPDEVMGSYYKKTDKELGKVEKPKANAFSAADDKGRNLPKTNVKIKANGKK